MEQKSIDGTEPLKPPSADIARQYLDEAEAVQRRRDERVDRRAAGWQAILSGITVAILITALLLVHHVDGTTTQPLIFLLIVTGQISAGFTERTGTQWRVLGSSARSIVALIAYGLVVGALFMLALIESQSRPMWMNFAPGGAILLGFVGYGSVVLWRDRGHEVSPAGAREPLPAQTRASTAGLGVLVGAAALSIGIEDELFAAIISVVVMMVVLVWMFLWTTDAGPQALGRYWRWPQITAYLSSMSLVTWLALQRAYFDDVTVLQSVGVAAAAVALLCGAAFLRTSESTPQPERVARRGDG